MPRQAGSFIEGNFTRGLITEANPLVFPANAASASDNVRFNRLGKTTRRKGIDFEANYVVTNIAPDEDEAIIEYVWEAVGGDGNKAFLVLQKGGTLHFYDISSNGNVSADKEIFTVNLDTFIPSDGQQPDTHPCQFIPGLGKLLVVNRAIDPFFVSFTFPPSLQNLVDGQFGNNTNESLQFVNGVDVTDEFIKFDYGSGNTKTITEVNFRSNTTGTHGTWKFQGSNDDSTYDDLGGTFTLGGTALDYLITAPSANTTAYRYYRLLGTTGTSSSTPWVREIMLRPRSTCTPVYDSGDRRSRITVTQAGFPSPWNAAIGGPSEMVDGISTVQQGIAKDFGSGHNWTSADYLQFDFGYAGSTLITEISLAWGVSDTETMGTFKWRGSNDASSWSDLDASFSISGSTGTIVLGDISANTTPYRYYRLEGISGATSNNNIFLREFTFKRCDFYDIGSQTNSITVTSSDDLITAGSITTTAITIQTRDVVGLDDGLAVDTRPTSNVSGGDADHVYNLYNQGWYPVNVGSSSIAALARWDNNRNDLPSNADVWWTMKDTNDAFDETKRDVIKYGNRGAPKGHYILPEFNKDRNQDSVEAGTGDTLSLRGDETTIERPSTVEFFAGRAWFAGVDDEGFSNRIYFSQIVEQADQFGKCHQKNDPTNETIADLLDDDGGVIVIPDAGTIFKLLALDRLILAFASNGIWTIGGSSGAFVTTDFAVEKISDINALNIQGFVKVKDSPFWWSEDGIYTAAFNADFTGIDVQSITEATIQETIDAIPALNKRFIKGSHSPNDKEVHWLYNSSASLVVADYYKYDKILTLNTLTGAFSVWTIQAGVPDIRGVATVKGNNLETAPIIKYTTTYDIAGGSEGVTFSEETNTSYKDWTTYATAIGVATDEKNYDSTFTTGYRLDGDGQRFFNSDYVFIYSERESNSSCLVQAIRDFSTDESSGKESVRQQVYTDDSTRKALVSRLKVRGTGRALQLKFHSESGKPFNIYGWGMYETVNARV